MSSTHFDYVIDADSPEEATALAMERYLKKNPKAKLENLHITCVEEPAEN